MIGTVTSYDSSTGVTVVNVTSIGSSGTYSSWTITQESSTALPALRITSNDTANALLVEDSTNPDSTPFVVSNIGSLGVGTTSPQSNLDVRGRTRSIYYDTNQGPSINGGYCFQYGNGMSGFGSYINNFVFYSEGITNTIDLYGEFKNAVFSSGMLDQALDGGSANTGLFIRCFVSTAVIQTTISTGEQQVFKGNYIGDIVINSLLTGGFVGWGINGITVSSSVNITTVAGAAQTVGGVPASGYIGFTATRETVSSNGTINLLVRGHTTADNATTAYQSFVKLKMDLIVN
jgi:hypothetical protein